MSCMTSFIALSHRNMACAFRCLKNCLLSGAFLALLYLPIVLRSTLEWELQVRKVLQVKGMWSEHVACRSTAHGANANVIHWCSKQQQSPADYHRCMSLTGAKRAKQNTVLVGHRSVCLETNPTLTRHLLYSPQTFLATHRFPFLFVLASRPENKQRCENGRMHMKTSLY